MKRLTLLVLTLGLTFGAFAQISTSPRKSVKTDAQKTELQKHVKGLTATTINAAKSSALKASGVTISDVTTAEDTDNGGFKATYTVTFGSDDFGVDVWIMKTDAMDEAYPNGAEDMIAETEYYLESYKNFYEGYGITWDDAYYFNTEGGEKTSSGLACNTDYTICVVCKTNDGTYTTATKEFTTGFIATSGLAAMETAKVQDVTTTDAYLEVKKNENTQYYKMLFADLALMEQYNLTTEDSVIAYFEANTNTSSYTQDTTWEMGDADLTSQYALTPNTDYLLWIVPFNSCFEVGTVSKIEFKTQASTQTGLAELTTLSVANVTSTSAELTVAMNDQTAYYTMVYAETDTLNAYNMNSTDSILAYFAANTNANKYNQNTTYILGADNAGSASALKANTSYTLWAVPFNGNMEAGTPKVVEFTTIESTQTGVAKMTVAQVIAVTETNAQLEVEKNDQTSFYRILYAETAVFSQYNIETEEDVINYFASVSNPSNFTQDTVWELGDDDAESQYALTPKTSYTVWVVPYNGNAEAGELVKIVFTTENGAGLTETETVNVNVYPNPATDYVQVIGLNGMQRVEILNTLGQTVFAQDTKANVLNINVQNFEKGTYFVKVTANGKVNTQKIVVK